MTLEKELLDFTNWLYDNNWKLIGDGMCLNTETKQIGNINDLAIKSKTLDYYPQYFQVGELVKTRDNGDEVVISNIEYDKYDREYMYWYEGEDGEEVYGFEDEFEKVD